MNRGVFLRYPSTSAASAVASLVFVLTAIWRPAVFDLPGLARIGIERGEIGEASLAFLMVIPALLVDRAAARRRRQALEVDAALAQAHDQSSRLAAIVESSDDAIMSTDLAGVVTSWNHGAEKLFGYTAAQMVGATIMRLTPEDAQPDEQRILAQVGGGRSVSKFETVRRKQDGTLVTVSITSSPINDESGRPIGAANVVRDMTERTRAEAALRQERDRAQHYLDAAEVILIALDCEARITLINRKGCDLLGWSEAELIGRNWMESCSPEEERPAIEKIFRDLLAGNVSVRESSIVSRTGEHRLIEWRNRLRRDEHGRVIGTFSSGSDITDRRSLELQFQQAQKMEAIGRLAGGVAHDFNNLLTAILGYSELVLDDLGLDDRHRRDLLEIEKAGRRAAALTRQLLAFSRRQIIEPTILDLSAIVTGMRAMIERLIGEDVRIVVKLPGEVAKIKADHGQVEQIIMNLAVNARDAMPNGGTLSIETANVHLDDDYAAMHLSVAAGDYVALIVSDTGVGMTPEVQARLFEPFFTTKEPGKGTGLGLATIHGIVARVGGSVGVYSEPGLGTSFKVYFPNAAAGELAVAEPRQAPRRTGTQTVLVVEDADGLRLLTQRLLERHGYKVLLAPNAAEALTLFEAHAPTVDILLTDVVMPGASGPELTRRLLERYPALRVIYMSGYTEDAIAHHGIVMPGVAFLNKPFTAETLTGKIHEVLER
jgi:PAS domain S-box-containing protein